MLPFMPSIDFVVKFNSGSEESFVDICHFKWLVHILSCLDERDLKLNSAD